MTDSCGMHIYCDMIGWEIYVAKIQLGRMHTGDISPSFIHLPLIWNELKLHLVINWTDYWFSLLLGCTFGWSQMGSLCIMVLCLAWDYRAHCWHGHSGIYSENLVSFYDECCMNRIIILTDILFGFEGICRITDTAKYHFTVHRHK